MSGNDEQEHHDRAVEREDLVVLLGIHEFLLRRQQFEPQQQGENATQEERAEYAPQVHEADAFVIDGRKPGPEALLLI
jgi:hypothetical protein